VARRETKMIIGPWGHGASQKYGDVDFTPAAMRSLFDLELRWNDHYLKGVDNGIDREPPLEIFFMGTNKWAKFADCLFQGRGSLPSIFPAVATRQCTRGWRPRSWQARWGGLGRIRL